MVEFLVFCSSVMILVLCRIFSVLFGVSVVVSCVSVSGGCVFGLVLLNSVVLLGFSKVRCRLVWVRLGGGYCGLLGWNSVLWKVLIGSWIDSVV